MSDPYLKVTCPSCGVNIEYPIDSQATSIPCPKCSEIIPLAVEQGVTTTVGPTELPSPSSAASAHVPRDEDSSKGTRALLLSLNCLLVCVLISAAFIAFKLNRLEEMQSHIQFAAERHKYEFKVVEFDPNDLAFYPGKKLLESELDDAGQLYGDLRGVTQTTAEGKSKLVFIFSQSCFDKDFAKLAKEKSQYSKELFDERMKKIRSQ